VASRFKELFGDIWSSLTDLEIMVDYIEVPDDGNMERIRNELAAAKVGGHITFLSALFL